MQTLSEIRALLDSHGLSPRHRFGQNFLIDHNLIKKLVAASGANAGDVVLEVGPGTGTMTEALLDAGCRVVAAEIDAGMCALLRERLGPREGFTLVEGDCLDSKRALAPALVAELRRVMSAAARDRFILVSNLPYAAGTPVMSILLADHPECLGLFATVQREVADRVLAKPGSKDYGPVSILAQAVGEVELVATLPPSCFWPQPDVTSAMIAIRRREVVLCRDPRALFDAVQTMFSQRRKQLGSVLGRQRALPEGVLPTMRAEELSVEQLIAVVETTR